MDGSGSPSSSRPERGRLPGGPPFDRVFRSGRSASNHLLILRGTPSELDITRWGFAVGRKSVPLAVDRNRIRRKLRAAAQAVDVPAGFDLVVLARPTARTASVTELRESLTRLLRRILAPSS